MSSKQVSIVVAPEEIPRINHHILPRLHSLKSSCRIISGHDGCDSCHRVK